MALKKLRSTLSHFKHYPAYPGIIMPDNSMSLGMFDRMATTLNAKEYQYRKKLAANIEAIDGVFSIPDDDGYLVQDMSESQVVTGALSYAHKTFKSIDWDEKEKSSKKAFLINHKFDLFDAENAAILQLAMSPEILKPISDYLGTFPVLSSAALWYSPNKDMSSKGSQLYHLDGEDIRQVKCFLPVEEITEDSGPLTILPADKSNYIYDDLHQKGRIKRRNTKLDDDMIYNYTDIENTVKIVGQPGTVAFVDTCRCYHYGSRTAKKPRVLLHLHFYSAFSKMMPLWGRSERDAQDSEAVQALIGKTHLSFANARVAKQAR